MSVRSGPALEIELGSAAETGPRVAAPFGRRSCPVTANDAVGAYRLVTVEDPDGPAPLAGQFYMLATTARWGGGSGERPYLSRAFSICRTEGARRQFLVEDIGPGTARLATASPGEDLWLVGPLGIGFSAPGQLAGRTGEPLLVGGGAGAAPLVAWQDALESQTIAATALLGFRSSAHAEAARLFAGGVALATDDGSVGHHGRVSELLERELDAQGDRAVYACGPRPMLEAVRRICAARGAPAELALEEAMACGFGACFGCVVRTRQGYRRICVDGPILRADELAEGWAAE